MKRDFSKETHLISFEVIDSFDDMLLVPTEALCFTENKGCGLVVSDVGFLRKRYTLIHRHPYYKILDCVFCSHKVNRETFHTCGYTFFEKVTKYKYGRQTFASWRSYADKIYWGRQNDETK